jgi:hypothetical protein
VDAAPWKAALDALAQLLRAQDPSARLDIVIRTDGQHHAVRITRRVSKPSELEALVALFRSTVPFFDQVRDTKPEVDEVLLIEERPAGPIQVLGQRRDVVDLFIDRIDAKKFVERLAELQ